MRSLRRFNQHHFGARILDRYSIHTRLSRFSRQSHRAQMLISCVIWKAISDPHVQGGSNMLQPGFSGTPRTLSINVRRRTRDGVQIHRQTFVGIVINSPGRGRKIIRSTSTTKTCSDKNDIRHPSATLIYSSSNRRFSQTITRKRLKTPLIFRSRNPRLRTHHTPSSSFLPKPRFAGNKLKSTPFMKSLEKDLFLLTQAA